MKITWGRRITLRLGIDELTISFSFFLLTQLVFGFQLDSLTTNSTRWLSDWREINALNFYLNNSWVGLFGFQFLFHLISIASENKLW